MSDNPRIEDLRRRVQRDPASIAFAQLAEEYRRAGQFDDAVQVCRSGLGIHPGYLSARVTLGRALLELGQLESAQHELQMVLVNAPDNLAAIRGIAEILHRRGALAEALAHYQRALGLARNDPDLEQTVTDLTRELGRTPAHPQPAPPMAATVEHGGPALESELLTLEQLTQELQKHAVSVPPPPASIKAPTKAPSAAVAIAGAAPIVHPVDSGHAADLRTIATLEQWLTAIDGFRAERRA